jgi:hypothetical protein
MSLTLIAGYTKHGKDTLFSRLSNKEADQYHQDLFLPLSNYQEGAYHRVAFADALKQDIAQHYQIEIPENKDAPLNGFESKGSSSSLGSSLSHRLSFRDLCISHSRAKKEENKYYYCEKVHHQILEHLKRGDHVFITDWRFPEELEYFQREDFKSFQLVTIRVFRAHFPIPDRNIISEHSLDNVKADYIAIDKSANLVDALAEYQKLFPL